jgi:hypothetical protein
MFPRNNFDMNTDNKMISGVQEINRTREFSNPELNYVMAPGGVSQPQFYEKVRLNSPKSRKALGSLTAVKNNSALANNQFTPGLVSPGQLVSSSIE